LWVIAIAAVLVLLAAGCVGETTLSSVEQPEEFDVEMMIDPPTLAPPQHSSLTYSITDKATGKKVTQFEPVIGPNVLLHNIVLREDLEYFGHTAAQFVVDQSVSAITYFPTTGSYKVFAMYKPLGTPIQQFTGRIVSGQPNEEANLQEGGATAQLAGSLRFDRVGADEPVVAGEVQQLAFLVSEKGQVVSALWPFYGAPAHLWIADSEAEHLWHAYGKADSTVLLPTQTSTPASARTAGATRTGGTPTAARTVTASRTGTPVEQSGNTSGSGSPADPDMQSIPAGVLTDTTPPTLVPPLGASLATITSQPIPTLPPVQQTPLVSVLVTPPAVPPAVGYGPTLVFEHTFPEPGLYKVWLEVGYRNEIITTDWVVRVVP
jgi:hypothetical protein